MNENTDRATNRPWHLNTLEVVPYSIHATRGVVAEVSRGTMNEVQPDEIEANTRLIVAAVNEYDVLCAIADIASALIKVAHCPEPSCSDDHKKSFLRISEDMASALSNLEAVRRA